MLGLKQAKNPRNKCGGIWPVSCLNILARCLIQIEFVESGKHLWMPTKGSKITVVVQEGEVCTLRFFIEMEALLGRHHDVNFPVVGTSEGIDIRRPDVLSAEGRQLPTPSQSSPSPQYGIGGHTKTEDESTGKLNCQIPP